MSFAEALEAAKLGANAQGLEELARSALIEQEEEQALPIVAAAAAKAKDSRLWQWTALMQRALDEHEAAIDSFSTAAALDPGDAGIAHGRARVALEAGVESIGLFEAALRLTPQDGQILLGLAAAKFAAGRGPEAEQNLVLALGRSPLWVHGHIQLAQLRSMLGMRDRATASINRALEEAPGHDQLWFGLFDLAVRSQDFSGLDEAVSRARRALGYLPLLTSYEAIAAAELGDTKRADRLFDAIPDAAKSAVEIWRVRHLLRTARVDHAVAAIDRALEGAAAPTIWPYAAAAWRLAGDPRLEWLQGDSRLISVTDLGLTGEELGKLAEALRSLHIASGGFLDQSVRGGTQTDGPLLSRIQPEIRSLRVKITDAVADHIAQLPAPDPGHPTLARRRDRRVRFSGSWSVLLRGAGRHVSHVHPQGWISSAFYVALPEREEGESETAGSLALGSPPEELGLELPALRNVQPRTGTLVLFPSWMWHGTEQFRSGERLTVAFDVQSPA